MAGVPRHGVFGVLLHSAHRMTVYCSRCGQLGHLYVHCPQLRAKPESKSQQKRFEAQIDPEDEVDEIIEASQPSNDAARVKRWRDANREHYNAYQRELMRRRRESGGS